MAYRVFGRRSIYLWPLEADKEKAMKVLEKAKTGCLVTNSMKTEIKLTPQIMELEQL
jgi:uncharacterized OsmC-like protein